MNQDARDRCARSAQFHSPTAINPPSAFWPRNPTEKSRPAFTRGGLLCNRAVRSGAAEPNPRGDRNEMEVRAGDKDVVEATFHEQAHTRRLDVESGARVEPELGVRG